MSAAPTVWPTSAGSRVDVGSTNQTPSAKVSATASAVGCYAVSVARWVFEDGVAQARTIEGHPGHAPRPLSHCAHALKGDSRLIGGNEVGRLCAALEALGRSEVLDGAAELVASLGVALERLSREL